MKEPSIPVVLPMLLQWCYYTAYVGMWIGGSLGPLLAPKVPTPMLLRAGVLQGTIAVQPLGTKLGEWNQIPRLSSTAVGITCHLLSHRRRQCGAEVIWICRTVRLWGYGNVGLWG